MALQWRLPTRIALFSLFSHAPPSALSRLASAFSSLPGDLHAVQPAGPLAIASHVKWCLEDEMPSCEGDPQRSMCESGWGLSSANQGAPTNPVASWRWEGSHFHWPWASRLLWWVALFLGMTQGYRSTLPSYFFKFIYLFQLEDNYNIVICRTSTWIGQRYTCVPPIILNPPPNPICHWGKSSSFLHRCFSTLKAWAFYRAQDPRELFIIIPVLEMTWLKLGGPRQADNHPTIRKAWD